MRYLLDTHILLWARAAPDNLSRDVLAILQSADSELYVSVATLWECAIKTAIGKLEVPANFYRIVASDYQIVSVEVAHLEAYAQLPMHHRDPFDRMLIVQAQLGSLVLLTQDRNIGRYDVSTIVN